MPDFGFGEDFGFDDFDALGDMNLFFDPTTVHDSSSLGPDIQ